MAQEYSWKEGGRLRYQEEVKEAQRLKEEKEEGSDGLCLLGAEFCASPH